MTDEEESVIQNPSHGPPASQQWWPSPFGGDDQRGMLNPIDERKRREALALVREGRLYDLSHLQIGDRGYNGCTVRELAGVVGVTRLRAETISQIVTRRSD
jgi:hypothetical protein